MNRTVIYLAGPEMSWFLLYVFTMGLVAFYQPLATDASKEHLLNYGWFLPLIGIILSFIPLYWAPGSHWIWLIRISIAGALGIVFVVTYLCGSVQYNDSRDSGIGSAVIVFLSLGWVALASSLTVAAVFLLTKWPVLPFLKWMMIILGILLALGFLINWLASLKTSS